MGGWISKAKNVFRREVPETPQPFRVECECGREHQGLRLSRAQHIVCKECGASQFIFPRDPYPPPLPRRRKRTPQPADEETIPVEESEPLIEKSHEDLIRKAIEEQDDSLPPAVIGKRRRKRKSEGPPVEPPPPPLLERIAERLASVARETWRDLVGFWTPLRSVVAGIALVIMLTALFSWRSYRLDNALETLKVAGESGLEKLADEDWIAARQEFERAVAAANLLGRHDPSTNNLRQYARETTAMTRLLTVSLFEMLDEAEAALDDNELEAWEQRFPTRFGSTWLVIDGTARRRTPSEEEKNPLPFALDFPWLLGGGQRSVEVQFDLEDLDTFSNDSSRPVIFAAQLESCRFDKETSKWIVRLNRETAFPWANAETLRGVGIRSDETRDDKVLLQLLEAQRSSLGLPEATPPSTEQET